MRRKSILNEKVLQNITTQEVINKFTRHCVVKNLSQKTIKYYQDNFTYFNSIIPNTYISEITIIRITTKTRKLSATISRNETRSKKNGTIF